MKVLNQQSCQRMLWWKSHLVLCFKGNQVLTRSTTIQHSNSWLNTPKVDLLSLLCTSEWSYSSSTKCTAELAFSKTNIFPFYCNLSGEVDVVRTGALTTNSLLLTCRSSLELSHPSSSNIKNSGPLIHWHFKVCSCISFPLVQSSASFIVLGMWCHYLTSDVEMISATLWDTYTLTLLI